MCKAEGCEKNGLCKGYCMKHAAFYEPEAYEIKSEKVRASSQKYRDSHPDYNARMRAYSLQHKEQNYQRAKDRDREELAALMDEMGLSEEVQDAILRPVDRAQPKR